MPATDKTRYDLRQLHVLFLVTAAILLVATIWMIVADHARPWKQYQLRQRALGQWALRAQVRAAEAALSAAPPAESVAARVQLEKLRVALQKQSNGAGEWLLRQPILDAFDTRRGLRIDQIWLPDLPIQNDFRNMPRFDRCVTCHQAIAVTAPGSAVAPAQVARRTLAVTLPQPAATAQRPTGAPGDLRRAQALLPAYGFALAETGQWHPDDAAIAFVRPQSRAARGGLQMGDVFRQIDGHPVDTRQDVVDRLLGDATVWGRPIPLQIERGLPEPFVSHPRLDLFVGALSPHKKDVVGCTVCHGGQGSATSFEWASHTPNGPAQALDWYHDYGWFDNRDWLDRMRPARLIESGCLKCHPDVVELESSERFPEPSAPKLLRGYHLIRRLGCFGCHEINGYDSSDQRVGPDLRNEPIGPPESFRDAGRPGTMRRVGPTLRMLRAKVDFNFVQDWIRKPDQYLPTARMPQPFGQWEHLEGEGLAVAQAFEPIEVQALTQYLLKISQPFEYVASAEGVTQPPSAERGKKLFEVRGCLACHRHSAWPDREADHGPDLSRIEAKLATPAGRKWLTSWLFDPHRYDGRTTMPNPLLAPIALTDADGTPTGTVTDPVADLVAFLNPSDDSMPPPPPLSAGAQQALRDVAFGHLVQTFPKSRAEKYIEAGIPPAEAGGLKGGARILVGAVRDADDRTSRLLDYVAWRSIQKYGCFGCHDIAGFEAAKPIGPTLTDWGRKESLHLAFESIDQFLAERPAGAAHRVPSETATGELRRQDVPPAAVASTGALAEVTAEVTSRADPGFDIGFYLQAIRTRHREGFIWQKLRAPRSYDFGTTADKLYNERLRMPRFQLDAAQREAIITFVLGLVNEPIPPQHQYDPSPRPAAILAGRKILDKYQCGTCHFLRMARWEFDYRPTTDAEAGTFETPPPAPPDFPLLNVDVAPADLEDSLKLDHRGLRHGVVRGLPELSEATGQPLLVDEDGMAVDEEDMPTDEEEGFPTFYNFVLWRPALIDGQVRRVGGPKLMVPPAGVTMYPAWGGDLARYLLPLVIADERVINPQVNGSEAWGWLPPALINEAARARPEWLRDYLLDPYTIRPATRMRMPRFNLSSVEAGQLADYFTAVGEMERSSEPASRPASARRTADAHENDPHAAAMRLVLDSNYCVKCHRIGDFTPQRQRSALAPDLTDIYRRLRPEFVRRWIANPARYLPYSPMPVNILYEPTPPNFGGVDQTILPGSSIAQLDALVDLLVNFDDYAIRHQSVRQQLEQTTAPAEPEGELRRESTGP